MIHRLGNVIWWFCLLAAFVWTVAVFAGGGVAGVSAVVLAALVAVPLVMVGAAVRYVLVGE